jgi:hypothetical protein
MACRPGDGDICGVACFHSWIMIVYWATRMQAMRSQRSDGPISTHSLPKMPLRRSSRTSRLSDPNFSIVSRLGRLFRVTVCAPMSRRGTHTAQP